MSIVCRLKMHTVLITVRGFHVVAVCVKYSANFYCKIALINRFKLYLIKTYRNTPKNKLHVNKNNVEYILRLH